MVGFTDHLGLRALTILGDESEPSNSSKTPVIRLASRFVSPLLAHALPHIRVSALNLVVQSPSITRPFTPGALNIIKTALPALHTESNAEVRDLTISALRNLIERVAFSSFSSEKELKNLQQKLRSGNRPTPDDIRKMIQLDSRVGDAKEFCVWYIGFLEMLLRPGSNYQRCITAFRSLGFLIKSGVDASLVEYAFAVAPGSGSITADGGIFKKGLLKWPGFSKDIRIFGPGIKRVLLEGMFNAFDDVRTMSAEILRFDPQWNKTDMLAFLGRGLKAMNESGRARDADGVARTVALVFEVAKRGEISFDQNDKLWGFEISGDGLGVVRWVLEVLEEYLSVSAADLQRAVKERPIHGIFASLGMILQNGGDIYTTEKDLLAWKEINERIFKACEDVWRLTKAPLCFDSPEGHVPSDIDEDDEGINTQTVMSYSWRAVKESSSLLGLILGTSPASTLASTDFERCGKQLLQQLADIRHRGAFSAVSPSFVALCTRCFESSDATLRELPRTWLRGSLESILEKSNAITRRSAGLPYLIMGVLASEIDPKRPLMSSTFARFVEIATLPATASKNGEKMDLPQVHALNCLKFLFTDARVSQVVVPYIGQGLELAVSCFGSEIWAIRNCGVMLFTALTNRLFGMRRSRNDYASSITTRYFFEKYRSVRTVLLKNLREKVGGLEGGDAVSVEMVYPALSLIARMEVDPGYDGMEEFREPIEGCMKCSIWKVREMAARAYTALVGPKDVVRVVQELMEVGPENQNKLHGNLCAVRALLERRVRQAVLEENGDQVWKLISETFAARFGDLVLNNRCAVTKVVALQLLTLHSDKFGLTDWIKEYVETCGFRRTREIRTSSVVGRSFFKEHLVAFILTFLRQFDDSKFPAAVTSLFADEDEEINLYAVNQLLSLSELPALQKESHERLWNIVDTHPWHLLGASALSLLSRLPVIATQERFDSLLALVQTPPTEPIKEAALTLLGPITAQLPADSGALQTLLLHLQKAAHDDEEYTLRTAALSSLTALAPLLKLGGNTPSPDSLIPAYALVYDLLNDDDGDIRLAAAELTQRILPGDAQILLLPLAAAEKLALTLPGYFAGSRALLEVAVGKVVGEDAARVAWEAAVKKDIILFQREKQNLWVDAVGVVEVWGVVAELVLARGGEGKEEVVERVRAWVGEAEELVGGMGENVVLGWASDEDVVVFLARVRVARRVLGR